MRNGMLVCMAAALLLLSAGSVYGGGVAGSWGLGTFLDYNRSIFKLKDWYETGRGQAGVVFTYVMSPRTSVEMEFHRSIFENGALEDRAFTWPIDGRDYKSPNALSEMRISSFLVNAVVRRGGGGILAKEKYSTYVTVGAGFYDYKTDVSGLIFPGQREAPLDKELVIEPFSDSRTALGANVGLGVEAFVFDNISLDVRARYNLLLGELRPMEAWGLEGQTFPMQFLNARGGIRFYFKK